MTDIFHSHIRASLADSGLQAALDANAERRIASRQTAFASLPDYQALRQRAHAVRSETIAHLDRYLKQFVDQAQANGLVVHRAVDAAHAVQIVMDIARQNNAELVAKSKTMVGEEIEINHALEAAGIQVVETDLGEYIVQLRGERPAHIITPAVHLRRADVGQTLHDKLGLPLTDDVSTMTSAARRVLRRTFLSADIGISGVNFGVAESGTLCVITNEGNGRMVTTLPPVHIALMGMERLVPTLDDLALMLALLPRSATGQKLTVYTNLIHGPRHPEETDGPRQRHLVIVDNGREALRKSPLSEILFCIRCGACLNACPVFREIGGHAYVGSHDEGTPYPGPIGSVVSPGLFGQAEFGQLARASSLCGACKEACPVDIDLPKLLLRVRAGGIHLDRKTPQPTPTDNVPAGLSWGLHFYTWFATSPGRFAFAQRLAGIAGRLLSPTSAWLRLPAFTGWGYSRDFPRPAVRSFRSRWARGQIARTPDEALAGAPQRPASHPGQSAETQAPEASEGATQPAGGRSLVESFASELAALGGEFILCDAETLATRLLALLQTRHITELLAWEAQHLPPGLLDALREAGIQVVHDYQAKEELSGGIPYRAGLTGALAAVAETGSLVLPGGPGRPQPVSLVPEVHIAVLRAGDIYARLSQALALPEVRQASSTVLVSGPSRTADIEMTLTIGVHGPGEVHVFCISSPELAENQHGDDDDEGETEHQADAEQGG